MHVTPAAVAQSRRASAPSSARSSSTSTSRAPHVMQRRASAACYRSAATARPTRADLPALGLRLLLAADVARLASDVAILVDVVKIPRVVALDPDSGHPPRLALGFAGFLERCRPDVAVLDDI